MEGDKSPLQVIVADIDDQGRPCFWSHREFNHPLDLPHFDYADCWCMPQIVRLDGESEIREEYIDGCEPKH